MQANVHLKAMQSDSGKDSDAMYPDPLRLLTTSFLVPVIRFLDNTALSA